MDNKEFLDWNEEMFVKYNNERLYLHPNPIVRWIENKRLKTIQNFIKLNKDQKFLYFVLYCHSEAKPKNLDPSLCSG